MSPSSTSGPSGMPGRSEDPRETAEYTFEEILQRLEAGRLVVKHTAAGSRLEVAHQNQPPEERRSRTEALPGMDRRRFLPVQIPTHFPESGAILVLLVGDFADDRALKQPTPFWGDDENNMYLLWQAMGRAGLIHQKDRAFALGRGGYWDEEPPRTHGLAMTYAGYRRKGEVVDVARFLHPWNVNRLQTLVQACWDRSMERLKIITLGEVARFMMCAAVYGMPGIPVLSISSPTGERLARRIGHDTTEEHWIEFASNLLLVGRGDR